jgi:hypothetical protein
MNEIDYQYQHNLPSEFQVVIMHVKDSLKRFGFDSRNRFFYHTVNEKNRSATFSFPVKTTWTYMLIGLMLRIAVFCYNLRHSHRVLLWEYKPYGVVTKRKGPIEYYSVWLNFALKEPKKIFL